MQYRRVMKQDVRACTCLQLLHHTLIETVLGSNPSGISISSVAPLQKLVMNTQPVIVGFHIFYCMLKMNTAKSPQLLLKNTKKTQKNKETHTKKHSSVHCLDVQSPLFTETFPAETMVMSSRLQLKPRLHACFCSVTKCTQLIYLP